MTMSMDVSMGVGVGVSAHYMYYLMNGEGGEGGEVLPQCGLNSPCIYLVM